MTTQRSTSDLALVRRLLARARPYWLHIAGIFALSLLASPIALLAPLPLKIAVDSALDGHPLPGPLAAIAPETNAASAALIVAAVGIVAIALLSYIQKTATNLLRTWTGEKLVLRFRGELFRHIQRLSLASSDARGSADSVYRIQYDAPAIQHVAIESAIPFVSAVVTIVAMLLVMARIDPPLALIALAIAPILFLLTGASRGRLRNTSRKTKRLESSAMSVVQEVLGALRLVKAFGQEDREQGRFVQRSGEGLRARLKLAVMEGAYGMTIGLTLAIGTALVLFMGVRHVQAGTITLGELLLVMGYVGQLFAPLKTMSRKTARLQSYLASAERAFALLDESPDVVERPGARPLAKARGEVTFENVSFAYRTDEPILEDMSFHVPAGAQVGVTGTTGAGKTTLVSLLTRFYDPSDGRILLDGVDMRDYRLADLRNQFSIVLQEPVLFSTTIAENIAYARPGAAESEVIEAARAAGAHDFIMQLADGYETQVAERGMRLSGGERQRIALARAFLRDAPLLILDEPTSSIDIHTEAAILQTMQRLMKGRTTFLVTHRPATLVHCDAQLVVENGRLVAATGRAAAGDRELRSARRSAHA